MPKVVITEFTFDNIDQEKKVLEPLREGRPARALPLTDDEREALRPYPLLTLKPVLYVANVGETDLPAGTNRWTDALAAALVTEGDADMVSVCSAIEAELSELDDEHRAEFLEHLGLEERGLDRLVRAAYQLLGLITFFTSGEKESRAWTVRRGARAPEAAGVIHSDFQRGFIRAETVDFETFAAAGSWKDARDRGLVRSEGKEYAVKDADIMLFRFNV